MRVRIVDLVPMHHADPAAWDAALAAPLPDDRARLHLGTWDGDGIVLGRFHRRPAAA